MPLPGLNYAGGEQPGNAKGDLINVLLLINHIGAPSAVTWNLGIRGELVVLRFLEHQVFSTSS